MIFIMDTNLLVFCLFVFFRLSIHGEQSYICLGTCTLSWIKSAAESIDVREFWDAWRWKKKQWFILGSSADKFLPKNTLDVIHSSLRGFILLTSRFRFLFKLFGI